MRFDRPFCPTCQLPARSFIQVLASLTEIVQIEDGSFGECGRIVVWTSECPVRVAGRYVLHCGCGEVWLARRLDADPLPETPIFPLPLPSLSPLCACGPCEELATAGHAGAVSPLGLCHACEQAGCRPGGDRCRWQQSPDPEPRN